MIYIEKIKGNVVILIILVSLVIGLVLISFNKEIVNRFPIFLFWIIWASVIFLSSFLFDLIIKKNSIITAILIFMGVMTGVITYIVLDIKINSTSHSLLGLEIIAFLFMTAPFPVLGIGLSQLILFFRRRLKERTS